MDYILGKKVNDMSRSKVELYEELLPDGRCKYRMPYTDKLTRKRKTLSVILDKQSAANYKLAKRMLEERLDDIILDNEVQNITLRRLCERYLDEKKRILKESTLKRNKASLERLIGWMGEDIYVNDLPVTHIKKVISEHSEENHTYNEYLSRFKAMLNWAFMNDYLSDRKVIDKLRSLPDNKHERIEDKYLEKEELKALLKASEDCPHWHYLLHFMVLSGLRVGEAIILKDSDIDEYIHVTATYQITTEKIGSPKTASSNRDVYVRKELDALIKEIRSWMREYTFKNGVRTDLFLCNSKGEHLEYYSFNKYLVNLSQKTIGRKITTHALRHTAASLLIADGVPLETVSRMLGHEGSKITKKIYLHMTKELQERDNKYLDMAKVL